jgi:hypothetical protein
MKRSQEWVKRAERGPSGLEESEGGTARGRKEEQHVEERRTASGRKEEQRVEEHGQDRRNSMRRRGTVCSGAKAQHAQERMNSMWRKKE